MKTYIPILLGSCRIGRQSLKVARWILDTLQQHDRMDTELIDLADYKLPILEERIPHMETPVPIVLQFCDKLKQADGVLIVTPEYKGSYPGVLKNALDYLEPLSLKYKPIGICTVSAGGFGGMNCLAQLRLLCLALGGLPIPEQLPISRVQDLFDSEGNFEDNSQNLALTSKLDTFIRALQWYTEALVRQQAHFPNQSPQ